MRSTSISRGHGRLSSSRSELFAGVFARGAAAGEVDDRAWLSAMLEVEAALARACALQGLIPQAAADAIAEACDPARFDIGGLGRRAASGGNPVIGLVEELRAQVGQGASGYVHLGATSQDVLDTAAMLVVRRAAAPILADAVACADACAALAAEHTGTAMIGRTLLQPARPTTFGLKAAGWMTGIDEASGALGEVAERVPAVQLGGAAGTRDGFDSRGGAVAAALAKELGLADPVLPWHANRVRPAAVAGALGLLAGALAKPARDVTLLAQGEVGEVGERDDPHDPGRGGSSAMAHKHNPVAAVSAVACALRVPGLVSTMHAAMLGEHERAAGAWHAEWETLSDLLRLTGSAAAWAREMLERLEVDAAAMGRNLEAAISDVAPDAVGEASALVARALERHRGRSA